MYGHHCRNPTEFWTLVAVISTILRLPSRCIDCPSLGVANERGSYRSIIRAALPSRNRGYIHGCIGGAVSSHVEAIYATRSLGENVPVSYPAARAGHLVFSFNGFGF